MKNYTEVVSSVKEIARDVLRMELISARQSTIYGHESDIKDVNEQIAAYNKDIARSEYRISKIEDANPDKESLLKLETAVIDATKKDIARAEELIKSINEAIAKENEGIAKIVSGETKVSKDALADLVSDYLDEVGLNAVKALKLE